MITEEQAFEQVSHYIEGQFPEEAVTYISSHKEIFEDRFIEILKSYADNPDLYLLEKDDYISALLFLGQLQSKKAFPVIIEFLKNLPHTDWDTPLGDCITEVVPDVLAACFDGNYEETNRLTFSKGSYLFARNSVNQMIEILLLIGKIDERTAINFLESTISSLCKEEKDDKFIMLCLDDLAAISIERCDNIVEKLRITVDHQTQEEIDYLRKKTTSQPYYLQDKERVTNNYNEIVNKGLSVLKKWPVFDTKRNERVMSHDSCALHGHHECGHFHANMPVRKEFDIGRNDPCFCGSGKKFKKCCLH